MKLEKGPTSSKSANVHEQYMLTWSGTAGVAMQLNAALNGVAIGLEIADLLPGPVSSANVILVGDVFYEKPLAVRALQWLRACRAAGALVLSGDPRRSYFPREAFEHLADYSVPVSRELEDAEVKHTGVWRLK